MAPWPMGKKRRNDPVMDYFKDGGPGLMVCQVKRESLLRGVQYYSNHKSCTVCMYVYHYQFFENSSETIHTGTATAVHHSFAELSGL